MLVLQVHDEKNPGSMSYRDDFQLAARSFFVLGHQGGTLCHSEVDKRQRALDEKLR